MRPSILDQEERRNRQRKHTLIILGVMYKFGITTLMVMLQVYTGFKLVKLHLLRKKLIQFIRIDEGNVTIIYYLLKQLECQIVQINLQETDNWKNDNGFFPLAHCLLR